MRRPNILFCIADDAAWLHFGAYGCQWVSTPVFDSVAARGVLFENCYTPNAKSAPSRASLLTGRYSWQLGEAGNHICHFPEDAGVFTEALEEAGYDVAFTGKGWAPGNPGMKNGRRRQLTGEAWQNRKLTPPTSEMLATDYAANFSDFLSSREDASRPWFFWFGCREPHRRYEYGSGAAKGGRTTGEIDRVPAFWPDNETVRNDMLDYGFEIEHYDRQLGLMLARLEELGELDNTLVIVTSDNGMPFPRAKGTQYEYAHHMPLAMMWPQGVNSPGRREAVYVSFVDIAPTILEIAGTDPSAAGMAPLPGGSLVPLLRNEPDPCAALRERALLGRERHDNGRPGDQGYPIRGLYGAVGSICATSNRGCCPAAIRKRATATSTVPRRKQPFCNCGAAGRIVVIMTCRWDSVRRRSCTMSKRTANASPTGSGTFHAGFWQIHCGPSFSGRCASRRSADDGRRRRIRSLSLRQAGKGQRLRTDRQWGDHSVGTVELGASDRLRTIRNSKKQLTRI